MGSDPESFAGTTYQLSVYQFLNTAENLLNQSVTATYMIL